MNTLNIKMSDVVTPYEFDHLVTSLAPLSLERAGEEAWVEQAGTIQRLSVGAVLQSGSGETELVAQLLSDRDKVKVIVQHVIILETWGSLAKEQTWYFTDTSNSSTDGELERRSGGHLVSPH